MFFSDSIDWAATIIAMATLSSKKKRVAQASPYRREVRCLRSRRLFVRLLAAPLGSRRSSWSTFKNIKAEQR